jgi:transcriptional regulator with XRE-family HTH domain
MRPLLKQQVVGQHVRRLRLAAGMSLRALGARTGFSASFISQVENGQVSPSIRSMEKIAEALGVSLGAFFVTLAEGEGGLIVRASDRRGLSSSWSKAEIQSLRALRANSLFEPVLITLRAGGRSGKHPYGHAGEEFAFVLGGRVTLTLGPQKHALRKGDAVIIRPQELRLWENPTGRAARILIVSSHFTGATRPLRR